jgi:hypothetical protein
MDPIHETALNKDRPAQVSDASFLVRFWWEPRADPRDPAVWRGRIEHVPSGWVAFFDDLAGLLLSIERWTGKLENGKKLKERRKGDE